MVDAQVWEFRDRQGAQGFPGYVSAGVHGARASARAVAHWRAGITEFDPVAAIDDRTISTAHGDLTIRVYRPSAAPTGVVTYFHGGGFVVGDLDTSQWHCRALCARCEAVVVSVDYALAPEHPFPTAVHQAHTAVRWVAENLTHVAGAVLPLAVAGDSAGASLATTSAMLCRDAGGPALAAQLLVYPMLDPTMSCPSIAENGEGYLLDRNTIEWFWNHYLGSTPPASPLAAPLGARLDGLPPAVVVTAGFDPFRDEGDRYADLLTEAGVPTRLLRYGSLVHGFMSFAPHVDAAQAAVSDLSAALRDLLVAAR